MGKAWSRLSSQTVSVGSARVLEAHEEAVLAGLTMGSTLVSQSPQRYEIFAKEFQLFTKVRTTHRQLAREC